DLGAQAPSPAFGRGFCKVVSQESVARSRGHLHPTARCARRRPRGCGPWVPEGLPTLNGPSPARACLLTLQQCGFTLHAPALPAPAITGAISVCLPQAMAGHARGRGMRGAGLGYGTNRRRPADGVGDLGVAASFAARNFAQLVPNLLLEGCALKVERDSGFSC